MSEHHDLDDLVRAIARTDDEQVARHWAGSRAEQALFAEVTGMSSTQAHGRYGSGRRAAVVLAATLAFAALAGAAVGVGVFAPDPEDVQAVQDQQDPEIFLPGTRPPLRAEDLLCVWGATPEDTLVTWASNGPLDAPLTADDLRTECATAEFAPPGTEAAGTVCGWPYDGRQIPAVLTAGGDCTAAGYEPVDVDALLATVNEARAAEIAERARSGGPVQEPVRE